MAREKILVVDGDITLSQMLQSRFQAQGYLVECAHDGAAALNILNNEWVDLVILAVTLQEGMNGFQLFKEIKKSRTLSKIPNIIQSNKAAMKVMFEEMGADAFFAKPCSVNTLLGKIKAMFEDKD